MNLKHNRENKKKLTPIVRSLKTGYFYVHAQFDNIFLIRCAIL